RQVGKYAVAFTFIYKWSSRDEVAEKWYKHRLQLNRCVKYIPASAQLLPLVELGGKLLGKGDCHIVDFSANYFLEVSGILRSNSDNARTPLLFVISSMASSIPE